MNLIEQRLRSLPTSDQGPASFVDVVAAQSRAAWLLDTAYSAERTRARLVDEWVARIRNQYGYDAIKEQIEEQEAVAGNAGLALDITTDTTLERLFAFMDSKAAPDDGRERDVRGAFDAELAQRYRDIAQKRASALERSGWLSAVGGTLTAAFTVGAVADPYTLPLLAFGGPEIAGLAMGARALRGATTLGTIGRAAAIGGTFDAVTNAAYSGLDEYERSKRMQAIGARDLMQDPYEAAAYGALFGGTVGGLAAAFAGRHLARMQPSAEARELFEQVRARADEFYANASSDDFDAAARVQDRVRMGLAETGMAPALVDANARIWGAAIIGLSRATGVDPETLFNSIGLVVRRGEIAPAVEGTRRLDQKVWHGSPHDFNKFTLDAIGTGEGAQVYGWGLYFAQRKGVAKFYTKADSPGFFYKGEKVSINPEWKLFLDLQKGLSASAPGTDQYVAYNRSGLPKIVIDALMRRANSRGDDNVTAQAIYKEVHDKLDEDQREAEALIASLKSEMDDPEFDKKREAAYKQWEANTWSDEAVLREDPPDTREDYERYLWFATASRDAILEIKASFDNPLRKRTILRNLDRVLKDWDYRANTSALYRVEIPDDDVLLHLDLPISEQPKRVQDMAHKVYNRMAKLLEQYSDKIKPHQVWTAADDKWVTGRDLQYRLTEIGEAINAENPAQFASLSLKEAGFQGNTYFDGASRAAGNGTRNFVVWDDTAISILAKFKDEWSTDLLFQRGAKGEVRGYVDLRKDFARIVLTANSDASTFMHESAHVFLNTLEHYGKADAELMRLVRAWLGDEIDAEAHEKFAEGFEKYLMSGVAPNPELASVFERFKQWLRGIYEALIAADKPVSAEVRAVFDRLLAEAPPEAPRLPEPRTVLEQRTDTLARSYNLMRAQAGDAAANQFLARMVQAERALATGRPATPELQGEPQPPSGPDVPVDARAPTGALLRGAKTQTPAQARATRIERLDANARELRALADEIDDPELAAGLRAQAKLNSAVDELSIILRTCVKGEA